MSEAETPFKMVYIDPIGNKTRKRHHLNAVSKYKKVPRPRSGHRIVSDRFGNVYSFGGYNPSMENDENSTHSNDMMYSDGENEHYDDDDDEEDDDFDELERETNHDENSWSSNYPLFDELWKYSKSTRTWRKLKTKGNKPPYLASHSVVISESGRYLLVYGGTNYPFGTSISNSIYVCDLVTRMWRLVEPIAINELEMPLPMYGQGVAFDYEHNHLYTVGGTTGYIYNIDVHRFDFETRMWTQLWFKTDNRYGPEERYRHEVVLYNKRLHIFGGGKSNTCFSLREIPVFNIETQEWQLVTTKRSIVHGRRSFPKSRKYHGCVSLEYKVFIIGGLSDEICDDIWSIDLTTFRWSYVTTLMKPVFFHAVSISRDGQLSIFGGTTNEGRRTSNLYMMNLKVLSLKELAWYAICNLTGYQLQKHTFSELIRCGIPFEYIQRLC